MPSLLDPPSEQKRRSFAILVVTLAVAACVLAFALSREGDGEVSGASSPSSDATVSPGQVSVQTACGEVAPDMALRVDALRRTAEAVRADIAAMESQGNPDGVAEATQVAVALENMADAQENQQGVRRATRELGETLVSIC